MQLINEISSDPFQRLTLIGVNGEEIFLEMKYLTTQQMWTYNIQYQNFRITGKTICSEPNILRKYRRLIPFGILVLTDNNLDPYLINQFSTGSAILGLLTEQEVQIIETNYYG